MITHQFNSIIIILLPFRNIVGLVLVVTVAEQEIETHFQNIKHTEEMELKGVYFHDF